MSKIEKLLHILAIVAFSAVSLSSCSKDEEVRMPDKILGIWSPDNTSYLEFNSDNVVRNLEIVYQDGETIGNWDTEVYYYEPGYNLVVYITANQEGMVYQIVDLTQKKMTWCPVDKIDVVDRHESIGKIVGDIIKRAQEGYKLNPELYESFNKISENEFLDVLETLDLIYPWNPWQ